MITIVYSTHKDNSYNNKFREHLLQTVGVKDVQILEYTNINEYSLAEIYNKGIVESVYDIVVCCHNDIKLEKNWGKKLLNDFQDNTDYGIIGKAGSCYFPESGIYWEQMQFTMVGQVYHHPDNHKKWLSRYSTKLPELIPVVTIDGLFISFDKTKIKHAFDETIGRFHFYDHSFCLPNYLDGVKIGVTSSFEITHQSVGQPNQEFFESKIKFLEKFSSKLPLDLKPNSIYVPKINEKPIKIGKVAVIIPTKNKFNLIKDCIESFYEHCNPNLFDIFIADTGSNEDVKNKLNDLIKNYNNIKLIEYDYYNFAKINNDVVKNHTNKEHEFLLFCNNDIKLLNNVIYGMLKIFKSSSKVGTVGCRLHFEDNTVQHDGVFLMINSNMNLLFGHENIKTYYNYTTNIKKVYGSTAALSMIRKSTFELCSMFNENYVNCGEDVELNSKCLLMGLDNYYDGNLVAYHYESQTRKDAGEYMDKITDDVTQNLIPFIQDNFQKLKPYIRFVQ